MIRVENQENKANIHIWFWLFDEVYFIHHHLLSISFLPSYTRSLTSIANLWPQISYKISFLNRMERERKKRLREKEEIEWEGEGRKWIPSQTVHSVQHEEGLSRISRKIVSVWFNRNMYSENMVSEIPARHYHSTIRLNTSSWNEREEEKEWITISQMIDRERKQCIRQVLWCPSSGSFPASLLLEFVSLSLFVSLFLSFCFFLSLSLLLLENGWTSTDDTLKSNPSGGATSYFRLLYLS